MSRRAEALRAERDLIRRCHSGLDSADLRVEVLRLLRRLMPIDAAFVATADPETLLFTGAWTEQPLDTATKLFLDNEFGANDVNKFSTLATAPRHVSSLDSATRRDRTASERYRDIMRPLGLGDELRAALVAGTECWGYLCLHREDHELGFSTAEATLLARLGPHIAHALRQAVLLRDSSAATEQPVPGILLLTDDLTVAATTPQAGALLSTIHRDRNLALPLPVAVYAVATALRAIEHGTAPPTMLPTTRVQTTTGNWLRLHASRLTGPSAENRITIIIEPNQPHLATPFILSAYGLTPREAEITTLVLRGNPTRTIANTLHISPHTVQDHLKSIFNKTGLHTRRDLITRLLTPQ